MLRSFVCLLAIACPLASAAPQVPADPSLAMPITSPIEDLGTFNWATKRWVTPRRAEALRSNSMAVYNNTCTWTGGNFYSEVPLCSTYFDEGRIPSSNTPGAPPAATDDNLINSFEIAYCTRQPTGMIDVKVGFFNNWGRCLQSLGGVPYPTPLSSNAQGYFDFGSAAGFPLPGDPAPGGGYQCLKVDIALGNAAFCLMSEGDGIYANAGALDEFAWSFESDTAPFGGTGAGVALIFAGEPSLSPTGGCTYNIPCGTDPSPWIPIQPAGSPCGSGLQTQDIWWINIDNDTWGDTVNTGTVCPFSPGSGSNCYFFPPGYPGARMSSFWLKLGSAGQCSGCTGNPSNYCTAGTTTNGCNATVSLQGVPSPRNLAPANIVVSNVEGAKTGLIFYGLQTAAFPWGNGPSFLCVKPPTQRILVQPTGGTAGQCDGTLSSDINAYFGNNPAVLGQPIFAGQVFYFQGWFRDPPAPKTTNLSNGLQISICP